MGFWKAVKEGYNYGKTKSRAETKAAKIASLSRVLRVVEPNYGRIITIEITAPEQCHHFYLDQLKLYSGYLKCKVTASGSKVTIECPDSNVAEIIRKAWSQP